jgi:hypothetical protein
VWCDNLTASKDDSSQTVEGEVSQDEDVTDEQPNVPIILPRMRYTGARNVSTIKDGKCNRFTASKAAHMESSKFPWTQ